MPAGTSKAVTSGGRLRCTSLCDGRLPGSWVPFRADWGPTSIWLHASRRFSMARTSWLTTRSSCISWSYLSMESIDQMNESKKASVCEWYLLLSLILFEAVNLRFNVFHKNLDLLNNCMKRRWIRFQDTLHNRFMSIKWYSASVSDYLDRMEEQMQCRGVADSHSGVGFTSLTSRRNLATWFFIFSKSCSVLFPRSREIKIYRHWKSAWRVNL